MDEHIPKSIERPPRHRIYELGNNLSLTKTVRIARGPAKRKNRDESVHLDDINRRKKRERVGITAGEIVHVPRGTPVATQSPIPTNLENMTQPGANDMVFVKEERDSGPSEAISQSHRNMQVMPVSVKGEYDRVRTRKLQNASPEGLSEMCEAADDVISSSLVGVRVEEWAGDASKSIKSSLHMLLSDSLPGDCGAGLRSPANVLRPQPPLELAATCNTSLASGTDSNTADVDSVNANSTSVQQEQATALSSPVDNERDEDTSPLLRSVSSAIFSTPVSCPVPLQASPNIAYAPETVTAVSEQLLPDPTESAASRDMSVPRSPLTDPSTHPICQNQPLLPQESRLRFTPSLRTTLPPSQPAPAQKAEDNGVVGVRVSMRREKLTRHTLERFLQNTHLRGYVQYRLDGKRSVVIIEFTSVEYAQNFVNQVFDSTTPWRFPGLTFPVRMDVMEPNQSTRTQSYDRIAEGKEKESQSKSRGHPLSDTTSCTATSQHWKNARSRCQDNKSRPCQNRQWLQLVLNEFLGRNGSVSSSAGTS